MPTQNAVVIGSNCFTGAHIVDALLDDSTYRVVGVSRSPQYKPLYLPYTRRKNPPFQFRQIDFVADFPLLARTLDELRPAVVVHVAALSEVALSNHRPIEYLQTNTLAVAKLCDHLRKAGYLQRYIHISSAEIFGPCSGAVSEQTLFSPTTPYAVSKAAADMFINTLIKNFNFPATLIRSTNVYGVHQQLFKIIPRTAIYLKLNKPIELHGGGAAVKNFVHVRDVVRGLTLALQKNKTGTYHLSVNGNDTVADIVRLVCRLMNKEFDQSVRIVGERLGQDSRYWLDCSKARQYLGWEPQINFEQGVQQVIDWIDSNWQTIRSEPLDYIHRASASAP